MWQRFEQQYTWYDQQPLRQENHYTHASPTGTLHRLSSIDRPETQRRNGKKMGARKFDRRERREHREGKKMTYPVGAMARR
jgi:hypothetical protein